MSAFISVNSTLIAVNSVDAILSSGEKNGRVSVLVGGRELVVAESVSVSKEHMGPAVGVTVEEEAAAAGAKLSHLISQFERTEDYALIYFNWNKQLWWSYSVAEADAIVR